MCFSNSCNFMNPTVQMFVSAHPTSSVNLRQQGRHVHDGDTSLDCSTCSLSPKGPMTIQKEYSVPSQIVEIGQKKGVTGDRDKVIQISSPS